MLESLSLKREIQLLKTAAHGRAPKARHCLACEKKLPCQFICKQGDNLGCGIGCGGPQQEGEKERRRQTSNYITRHVCSWWWVVFFLFFSPPVLIFHYFPFYSLWWFGYYSVLPCETCATYSTCVIITNRLSQCSIVKYI